MNLLDFLEEKDKDGYKEIKMKKINDNGSVFVTEYYEIGKRFYIFDEKRRLVIQWDEDVF